MLQEYACTGVGARLMRIFGYRGGWGVKKWLFGGRTYFIMDGPFADQHSSSIQVWGFPRIGFQYFLADTDSY